MKNDIFFNYDGVFHSRLRDLIKEHEITKQKLSEEIGVSRQAISQYCDGSTIPNADKLLKIAEFFNTSTDYLLGLSDVQSTDTEVRAICEYTGLSEEAIGDLHLIVENINKESGAYPSWLTAEDIFESKEFEKQVLQMISYFIYNERFKDAVVDTISYMDTLSDRISAINALTEKINKEDKLDSALVHEIDNLMNIKHDKAIRLAYFEMIDSFKTAAEEYCNPLIKEREEAEINLGKYWGEAALYKHLGVVSDERAKEIRKEIMNSCSSISETVNELAKKMGEANANNNQTE